jgi:hypothetical protein
MGVGGCAQVPQDAGRVWQGVGPVWVNGGRRGLVQRHDTWALGPTAQRSRRRSRRVLNHAVPEQRQPVPLADHYSSCQLSPTCRQLYVSDTLVESPSTSQPRTNSMRWHNSYIRVIFSNRSGLALEIAVRRATHSSRDRTKYVIEYECEHGGRGHSHESDDTPQCLQETGKLRTFGRGSPKVETGGVAQVFNRHRGRHRGWVHAWAACPRRPGAMTTNTSTFTLRPEQTLEYWR